MKKIFKNIKTGDKIWKCTKKLLDDSLGWKFITEELEVTDICKNELYEGHDFKLIKLNNGEEFSVAPDCGIAILNTYDVMYAPNKNIINESIKDFEEMTKNFLKNNNQTSND